MEFFLLNALLKVFLFLKVCDRDQVELEAMVLDRGGVEDTRFEAKAKDTNKILGQGQGQPFQGQTLSRPRPRTKDTSASALRKKKGLHKNFLGDLKKHKKKKVFTKIFQAISTKKRFPKNFSSAPQNFNNSKSSAVLEPRTGQFSRTWGQELDLRGQGQGLQNVSSRTPPLVLDYPKFYNHEYCSLVVIFHSSPTWWK